MKGLFTDTEMNSDNVKDRDSKIAFLQKAIDLTGLQLLHLSSYRFFAQNLVDISFLF